MDIVYGTTNIGKITSMKKALDGFLKEFNINIIGLNSFNFNAPSINENGNNPLENARIKALAYYSIIKKPVFSLDSGLYFEGLSDKLQPGLHVRRVNGKVLGDSEMMDYYAFLARENGGKIIAQYINGIYLVLDDKTKMEYMGEDISSEKFIICDKPHKTSVEGFPLDSLSINIDTNMYYYDLENRDNKENAWRTEEGFREFFRKAFSKMGNN